MQVRGFCIRNGIGGILQFCTNSTPGLEWYSWYWKLEKANLLLPVCGDCGFLESGIVLK